MSNQFKTFFFDEIWNTTRSVDIFIPQKITNKMAIFIIHGGGHAAGDKTGMYNLMWQYQNIGLAVASVNYRLAPQENCASKQIEDVGLGYKKFTDELVARGLRDPEIIVQGGSAGAALAGLFVNAPSGTFGEPKVNFIKPKKLIHACGPMTYIPWKDEFPGSVFCANSFTTSTFEKDPELFKKASLLTHLSSSSPATFFLRASNEHFFPNDQVAEAENLLKNEGVEAFHKVYGPAEHGFFHKVENTPQKEAWEDVKKFIGVA